MRPRQGGGGGRGGRGRRLAHSGPGAGPAFTSEGSLLGPVPRAVQQARCSQPRPFAPGTSRPSGRQVPAVHRGALAPRPAPSPSRSAVQLARGLAQSLPLWPRASFLKAGDFHVFFFFFPNWDMLLKKYQDEPGDPGKLSETPLLPPGPGLGPSLPGLQEGWRSPLVWRYKLLPSHGVCRCHPCLHESDRGGVHVPGKTAPPPPPSPRAGVPASELCPEYLFTYKRNRL